MLTNSAIAVSTALFPLAFLWAKPAATKAGEPDETQETKEVEAHVYHCHDGDTCRVRVAGGLWFNIRLAAIDAPEVEKRHGGKTDWHGQPLGEVARDALNKLIEGQDVRLRQVDLDQYNRPVAEVIFKDEVVNKTLVAQGLAEVYRGKTKRLDKDSYFKAEEQAKKDKKGIWGMAGYQSPTEYRRQNR